MVTTAILVFGAISFRRLSVELMPPIRYPTMTIRTEYPGSAPEEVEKFITEPIEEEVGVLGHLETIESRSRAGVSDIRLEFTWGTDMDQVLLDLREKLNQVANRLPKDAGKPLILRYDPSLDPILRVALYGESDRVRLEALKYVAEEDLKRDLSRIGGVAAVEVHGGLEEEIRIEVDRARAAAAGVDPALVVERVRSENVNVPAGDIEEGETKKLVRTLNEFRSQEEIEGLVLLQRGDAAVRLADVATVSRTYKEQEVLTRVGGRPAVLLDVYKEAQANLVEVAAEVRERLEGSDGKKGLAEALPEGARVAVVSDRSVFVEDATREVEVTAVLGGALAVVILFFFLRRFSSTLLIGASIPLSVLATFAPMHLGGLTLNVMSLGGLALGIGMLVDNSIVVLESIHRCREDGDDLRSAAVRGTSEVAGAVIASTLTTVAVFVPLVFVSGVAGQLFRDQALTVVYSLIASLVVSLTVIPMLAGRAWGFGAAAKLRARWVVSFASVRRMVESFAKGRVAWRVLGAPYAAVRFLLHFPVELAGKLVAILSLATLAGMGWTIFGAVWLAEKALWPLSFVFDLALRALHRGYRRGLAFLLDRKWLVAAALAPLVWLTVRSWERLGSDLLPPMKEGEFRVEIAFAAGKPIDSTDEAALPLARELAGKEGVERVFTQIGVEPEDDEASEKGSHTAQITVVLARGAGREREEELEREIRQRLSAEPEIESVRFSRPTLFTFKDPVAVVIFHDDLAVLARTSERVVEVVSSVEGTADVRSSLTRGNPELLLEYDREALARYQMATRDVAERIRRDVLGEVPTQLREGERKIDIRVRIKREGADESAMVSSLRVTPAGGADKRLDEVATITSAEGPSEIRHVSHQRAAVVTAAAEGFDLGTLSGTVRRDLARMENPDGASLEVAGQNQEMEASRQSMFFAMALAVFLVYVVMASQFESLVHPLTILFSVPLAAIGVVLVLDALSLPLSILVYTGAIVLAGVVVNNAIVLVDCVNYLRSSGVPRREAVVRAAELRLRPILMTTLTTVVGLLPMTGLVPMPLSLVGEGVELRAPLSITIMAGLAFSTLLTLIVIPVVYELFDPLDPSSRRKRADDAAGDANATGPC